VCSSSIPFVVSSLITGKKLFGDGYSGLEYDYRGLINLYDSQGIFLGFLLLSELKPAGLASLQMQCICSIKPRLLMTLK